MRIQLVLSPDVLRPGCQGSACRWFPPPPVWFMILIKVMMEEGAWMPASTDA